MSKPKSGSRRGQGGLMTGLIILGIAGAVIAAQALGTKQSIEEPRMTMEPQIVTNLTELPQTLPLSGDAAVQLNELRALVESCPDYEPARQSQMIQHIEWFIAPALIPPDVIIALGANPTGKLIFGMATYTSIQWNLIDHAPASCLLPIGKRLNEMLIAAGEESFPVFDESS